MIEPRCIQFPGLHVCQLHGDRHSGSRAASSKAKLLAAGELPPVGRFDGQVDGELAFLGSGLG